MRRSAIDSLQRGVANLIANWQLVIAQFLQTILVSMLVVAGAIPFVLAIGLGTLRAIFGADPGRPSIGALEELMAAGSAAIGPLVAATVAATVVWTIAIVVYAYFQAGIFGILSAGDERAPSSTPSLPDFRAFSVARFRVAGDRGFWTFFWLLNVFMLVGTVALAMIGGGALVGALLLSSESAAGGIAVGCLGVLLLIAVSIGLSFWWMLAMACAAGGEMGVSRSMTASLRVLVRRAGGVLVLGLLAVAAGITVGIAFTTVGFVLELASGDSLTAYILVQVLVSAIQSLASAVIGIAFAGALVAIVRGERTRERLLPA